VAFRLREDEPIAKGLHRVVKRELRTATDCLTGETPTEAIHEARKSIKKVRAVLQLVGDDIGANGAFKELRRASHLLTSLRDVDAMIETARSLRAPRTTAVRTVSAELHAHLAAQQATLMESADHTCGKAARALDRVRHDVRDWHWKRTDFSAFEAAITKSYKRARKVMHSLRDDADPEALHEWRKRVKTLWYGLRLLEERLPRLRRTIADFKRLETWLGDDHNLVVLEEQLRVVRSPRQERAELETRIEQRHRALQGKGLTIGARLFEHPPKAFSASELRRPDPS